MHPRQFSFLILSLLLIYFAASGVSAFDRPAVLVGNYRPIKNLNDPHLIEIAMFAVTEYNKEEGTDLEYMKIVRGESQVVAGINYRLVIAAKDGAYLGNYEAVVYERIWQHYRSLTSFKKL